MTLTPFLAASTLVQVHILAGLLAILLGVYQLARPKGDSIHRKLGYVWIALLLVDAATAWFLYSMPGFRMKNPVHLLSVLAPLFVVAGVMTARLHYRKLHGAIMMLTFFLYMVVVFALTFNPGRVMNLIMKG